MRRSDLFTKAEEAVLASLDEPFRTTFRVAAIAVNDKLGLAGNGDLVMNVEDGWRDAKIQEGYFRENRVEVSPGKWQVKRDLRGKLLPIKTNARGGYSPHQYHRAGHIVIRYVKPSSDGFRHWLDGKDPRWLIVRDIVAPLGLISGATFKSPYDPAHVESADWRDLADLLNHAGLDENDRRHNWKPSKSS